MAEILTQDEINALLAIIDETDEEDKNSDVILFDFKRPHFIRKGDIHDIQTFFENMRHSIKHWVGHDIQRISLHSVDYLSYSDFTACITDLAEHYIEVHCKKAEANLDTNVVLGIDDTLLIGLNGASNLNKKTGVSEFNELKIAEGIVSFLEDNNVIDSGNVLSQDKDYKEKQFPGYYPGIVALYEIFTVNQSSGLFYMFIPFELIKYKLSEIKGTVAEIDNQDKLNKLSITAKLGEAEISLSDLKENNTIFLNKKADDPIELHLGCTKVGEGEVIVKDDDTLGIIITKIKKGLK